MMMNTVLRRLGLPVLSAPPARPPHNSFRIYAVALDYASLDVLQRVIDVEIQKHRFDLLDHFCGVFRIYDLMWLDSLMPADDSQIVLTGLEYRYLLAYVTQRMLLILHRDESILAGVSVDVLHQALTTVRDALRDATEIVPLGLFGCY